MSLEPILALIVVAVMANLVVMGVLVASPTVGRIRSGRGADDAPDVRTERALAAAAVVGRGDDARTADDGETIRTYDRVVRIASWVFLLAVTTIVGVTGLWPESQSAIFLLLALGGVFVLVIHDLLPATALGPAKFVLEGSVAITVATVLVALTGGATSPFFFVYPLIVGGAALVVSPPVTLGLAITAAIGYLLAVTLGSPSDALSDPITVATVGINLTAMVLLAYIAMVIAREQRSTRDAAIRLSTIDPLTSLFNRGFFFAALEREIARSARSGRGFCLLMMDLDELKAINDRLGHFHGDRVLAAVGQVVSDGVRRIDTAARYGGDEFVVLLPETDPTGAFVLAEKIRIGVNDLELDLPEEAVRPSLSVGVVSY
ncbi:MAG TPA: diguanylate cyclase, partial [Candidatus Limnocylindria bacterium]|nr:diguanylate cyclase [Candidatus Limnocylindria bacterium]